MSRKRYRPKKEAQPGIQACDWCGSPFAREMVGGYFCDFVCKQQWTADQKDTRDTRMMTVGELIDQLQSGSQD